jgi:type II secretory pathway component PulF
VGLGWLLSRLLGDAVRARLALVPPFAQVTLPMVGANVCTVLRAALASGLPMPESVELAARACGNPIVGERLSQAANELRHQRLASLSLALARGKLPPLVVDHTRIGERSGTLETTLGQAGKLMRESFRQRSEAAARAVSGLVYAAAVLGAGVLVLMFWSSYQATLARAVPEG